MMDRMCRGSSEIITNSGLVESKAKRTLVRKRMGDKDLERSAGSFAIEDRLSNVTLCLEATVFAPLWKPFAATITTLLAPTSRAFVTKASIFSALTGDE